MTKQEILDSLNLLDENQITIFLYHNILKLELTEIAKQRNPNLNPLELETQYFKIRRNSRKIHKVLNHDEIIAALQVLFCLP